MSVADMTKQRLYNEVRQLEPQPSAAIEPPIPPARRARDQVGTTYRGSGFPLTVQGHNQVSQPPMIQLLKMQQGVSLGSNGNTALSTFAQGTSGTVSCAVNFLSLYSKV
jgi:hypothetical protein